MPIRSIGLFFVLLVIAPTLCAQGPRRPLSAEEAQHRVDVEKQLEDVAVIDRKVMVRMSDGKSMAADIYRPKDTSKKYPVIFVRTPYNFNYWDIQNGVPRDMTTELTAIQRGYAFVEMNERGHFFSEGNYDILGPPRTDGYDAIKWISSQPWSNGKVGLEGCSSTAEWQMGVAATAPPGLAAINPQGFGAGVGRVKPYYEQGNWYRGGAVQMLFIAWLYGEQNETRPMFPPNSSQQDLIRESKSFDLAPHLPPVDWSKGLSHLPEQDIIKAVDGPPGIFADPEPVPTGGRMIQRTPNDPAWYKGGLFHDDMKINVPGLWFMSWYDVSVGPNLATYNYVRRTANPEIANEQWAVIAPTLHCSYRRASSDTKVGERDMGDARLNGVDPSGPGHPLSGYDELSFAFFDRFLKGEASPSLDKQPKVLYYTMGENKWQSSETWPPAGAKPMTLYFTSAGKANTLNGDGGLGVTAPSSDAPDRFTYDPASPVPSYGGNVCCTGNAVVGGAMDQRKMEERTDILVYSSEPLKEGVEVSGPIEVTLYVSSDVKDTDVTVKLIDVAPNGPAYNLDETIQRLRYRDGYDKAPIWMENGKVYEVTLQPMNTSNYFAAGHQIRIEVSGSNFPRFDRNLNTGGNNYDETRGAVAHTAIHHSKEYPSAVTLTVVKR